MNQTVLCPSCDGTAQRMPVLSALGSIDYFQCTACNSVSLKPEDSNGPAQLLTLSPRSSSPLLSARASDHR